MSKLSFRARALDATKPMPIYYVDDVPEFQDIALINRAVPQMPTGMEKEEECEHHLQRAISAQQAYGHTGERVIPTPEVYNVSKQIKDELYPTIYKSSRQLIHVQPFSMDQDIPDYDMDSEDEKWLEQQSLRMDIKPLQYEEMMDRLEKGSGQQVVTLKEAKLLLKDDDDIIIAVYDYWLNKRLTMQHPLIPQVKTEKRDGSTNNNPYVAFRRRTEKMQTRKNRKNDEASYEKMLKLRRDLSRAVILLEMVKRREKAKREMLHLTTEVFEKRYQAGDFSGQILAEVSAIKHPRPNFISVNNSQVVFKQEARVSKNKPLKGIPSRKRQYKRKKPDNATSKASASNNHLIDIAVGDLGTSEDEGLSSIQSDQEDEIEPDGQYAFKRKRNCSYHAPLIGKLGSWPWCSAEEGGYEDKRYKYCLASITIPRPICIGFSRRRIGRGGRLLFDRAYSPLDSYLHELDRLKQHTTNGKLCNNELLNEINSEWSHFRPKVPSEEEPFGDTESDHRQRTFISSNQTLIENKCILDNVKKSQSREDELFELQRKQVERLKTEEITSPSFYLLGHSYSSPPASIFKISSCSKVPSQYHPVIAVLEDNCSSVSPLSSPSGLYSADTSSSITSSTNRVVLTNGPVIDNFRVEGFTPPSPLQLRA